MLTVIAFLVDKSNSFRRNVFLGHRQFGQLSIVEFFHSSGIVPTHQLARVERDFIIWKVLSFWLVDYFETFWQTTHFDKVAIYLLWILGAKMV